MATAQINGQPTTINSTKNNSGSAIGANSSRNNMNSISTSNNQYGGSSVVINSTDTDPADSSGIFSYNNNRPIIMPYTDTLSTLDKKISGNYPITNNTKIIRTTLTATAIRLGKFSKVTGEFDAGYPTNASYAVCPDVLTASYQIGQQSVGVDNPNPSDCDQFADTIYELSDENNNILIDNTNTSIEV